MGGELRVAPKEVAHLAAMWPQLLLPTDALTVQLSHGPVLLPLCRPSFIPATNTRDVHTFGGKDLLLVDGRAQFAEVAILRLFEEAGWHGRWLETYGKAAMKPALWREWNAAGPSAQLHAPIEEAWVHERLHSIAVTNGNSFSGCWDVVAWSCNAAGDGRLVFAESKKAGKDKLRGTQLRWVEAAMRCGVSAEDFLVVEWSLAP